MVSGLTSGTSYTFTVVATNSAGNSPASAPSNAVIPGITIRTFYYAGTARIAVSVNGTFSFLVADELASTEVALSSSSAAAIASILYGPYGNTRYTSGTMPTDYGFTGQHADSATGLDYYNARYFDPASGLFITPDTILPGNGYDIWGLSRYAYVEGNPESRTDPSGKCPWCIGAVIGAVVGAAINYGSQVVGNLQRGQDIGSALTHVNVADIGKAALVGAVVGATGGAAAGLLAGGGVVTATAGAIGIGAGEGALGQIGDNMLHGRSWHQDVAQAALFGAVTAGIGGGAALGARQLFKRFASEIVDDGAGSARGSSRGPSCETAQSFSAETTVATPGGRRLISQLKTGDRVVAFDPKNRHVTVQVVTRVFVNRDRDLVDVHVRLTTLTNGPRPHSRAHDETIHTTAGHPWLTADRAWVSASPSWGASADRKWIRGHCHERPGSARRGCHVGSKPCGNTHLCGRRRWLRCP